jgi:hypothetical protein
MPESGSRLYKKYETVAKVWAPIALFVAALKTVFVDIPEMVHKIPSEIAITLTIFTFKLFAIPL